MRIGELAQRSGVGSKTIRFYESAGLLPPPQRTPTGYRDFDLLAVSRLSFIKNAQACGLTLAEVRDVIAVRERSGPPCAHVRSLLDRRADELSVRLATLHELLEEVNRLRDRAGTLDDSACAEVDVCHVISQATRPAAP